MVEYADKNLAREEHQKAESKKFSGVNNRVQQAYMNKAIRSKPATKDAPMKK
jgi:bifunctional N-acetylglucosamine-1-phosphate-uridyltransferase/glucosamine-1-phosphate-acetyltransferase GlmU-like protein